MLFVLPLYSFVLLLLKPERVQQRVTKIIPRLKNVPYEGRLKEVNLLSLSKRRMQTYLIDAFEILKVFNINIEDYLTVDQSYLTRRQKNFKIIGKIFLINEAKHFFSNRVVDI